MKKRLIIYIIFFIFFIYNANALSQCYPDGKTLCTDAFISNGFLYCDIDNTIICDYACNNGKCITQNGGTAPIPVCNENYEQCGLTGTYDMNSDPYKCVNGKLELKYDCPSGYICIEQGFNFAYCKSPSIYYCISPDNYKCYSSDFKQSNCFDSLDACQNNFKYWCLNKDTRVCVERTKCLSGEAVFTGTDFYTTVKASCENSINRCEYLNPIDYSICQMGLDSFFDKLATFGIVTLFIIGVVIIYILKRML